jgi:type IV pilus assembly protein PilC
MPVFVFRGRNTRTNESVSGERFSNSSQALAAVLRREQILPVSIREKKTRSINISLFKKGVSQDEIAIFTRQFSVMLDAGLPLVQCLDAMAQQNTNTTFKEVLEQVRGDVESGSTMSEAMAHHPKVFDSLYTNMIAAGEAGGILDTILQRLAQFIEKIVKLKRALRSALVYPAVILSIAIVVVGIILWKVVPVFRTLFEGFNIELPLLTRIVIAASNFLESYFFVVVAFIFAVSFGLRSYYATDKGRHVIDAAILKVPILGEVFRKIAVARFTRTLATLLASGVPILECMDITARTAGNAILEDAVKNVRKHIEEGKTMAEPMKESKFFPTMVVQMVSVGESTGEMDTMLVKVADYYEDEVDVIVASLLTILEPIMLVILGGIVGGIVIAMYMPLFKLITVLSGG